MSPARLALRTLMLGSTRSALAIVLIAASLCVLDLYAGHIASVRAQVEQRAVIGERLGHLAVQRAAPLAAAARERTFEPVEAQRVQGLLNSTEGVALALPQMRVSGIAAAGSRSILFHGEGISAAPERAPLLSVPLPGRLDPKLANGIALTREQAGMLGVSIGSKLSLTAISQDALTLPLQAQVVDIYKGNANATSERTPLLMPFQMAQTLQGTKRIERFAVYLHDHSRTLELRVNLTEAFKSAGIPVRIMTWYEQSGDSARQGSFTELAFDSVAGMVFAVIAATVAATIAMNAFDSRREVATMRALGMRSSSVFLMFVMESLWMALIGVAISLVASAVIAWIINRAALSYTTGKYGLGNMPMLVELDFNRISMAVVAALAVALLAALVPAFRAARAPIAPAL
ncbi:MAG: FtsX-like permease family protein [Pseudomonadota bacterium]